jgi:hypothetical protein
MALGDKNKDLTSKSGTYKRINKEEFEECLAGTELDFHEVNYDWTGELVYEAYSKNETFTIRVFSSLNKHSGQARDKGSDAIRVVLLHTESDRPLMKNKRVHRIDTFCKNLRQRISKIVGNKQQLTYCPRCDGVMVIRENKSNGNKFYGCSNYPECKGTRSISN